MASRRAGSPRIPSEPERQRAGDGQAPLVGETLRRLRQERQLSLAGLAGVSGVSRAMLSQVELGQSVPTVTVLWRIAGALRVPFSALLNPEQTPKVVDVPLRDAQKRSMRRGGASWRPLHPAEHRGDAEFYEVRLEPQAVDDLDAKEPGTIENLVVASGTLELSVQGQRRVLRSGDATVIPADQPRTYRNLGSWEAVLYVAVGRGRDR